MKNSDLVRGEAFLETGPVERVLLLAGMMAGLYAVQYIAFPFAFPAWFPVSTVAYGVYGNSAR